MRDEWYGDKHDLVKWGVLLELARHFQAARILQVPYWRPNKWTKLQIDGMEVELHKAVIKHLRTIANISEIQSPARVEIIKEHFVDRDTYHALVLSRIREQGEARKIVLLDPDTGLQSKKPNLKHVLVSEVSAIWRELHADDVLVLYQHQTNRNGSEWIESKREQFEKALNLKAGDAKLASAPQIAQDVVLFYRQKGRHTGEVGG